MNSNKGEIKHLESISSFYEKEDAMDELIMDRELDIIKKYCSPEKSVLEVGCGSGASTVRLASFFKDLEVVEPASGNVKQLKEKIPDITCHQFLLEQFKSKKKYDYVFSLNVVEHVEAPVLFMHLLSKLIKDDGFVFISCPNSMSLNRRAGYEMGLLPSYSTMSPKDIQVGHRRMYTVKMLQEHCDQAGLSVIDVKGVYLKPLSEKQMIALGDDAVNAFYKLGEDIPEYCANILAITKKKYY